MKEPHGMLAGAAVLETFFFFFFLTSSPSEQYGIASPCEINILQWKISCGMTWKDSLYCVCRKVPIASLKSYTSETLNFHVFTVVRDH